ncbi:MAG TPA: hypothetical protein VM053_09250 [Gemmatimonadaceae bacterium]|nr:hypothetical protein [Gemmatimonadaceae bacterium]
MKMNSRGLAVMGAMALVFAVAGCKKKDAAATDSAVLGPLPDATTPAAAPIHVTDVSTGKGLTADKNLANSTSEFGVRDTIYVLVKTDGASAGSKLDAKWTFNNGAETVKDDTQNIAPAGGESRFEFHVSKPSAWPKGNYKVEIMLDGTSAGSKDFTIK